MFELPSANALNLSKLLQVYIFVGKHQFFLFPKLFSKTLCTAGLSSKAFTLYQKKKKKKF